MINMNVMERILHRIQWSAVIRGARPLNAIIIGPSGGGKSLLLTRCAAHNVATLMDFTSESLLRFCDRERPRYIVCPDLNIVVSHKPAVSNLTIAALLALTGEGISRIPGIDGETKFRLPENYVCGVLTACTYDMYVSKRGKWRQIGLLRRLMPLYFSYTPSTVMQINSAISRGMTPIYKPNGNWKIPTREIPIAINDTFSMRLNMIADLALPRMGWGYKDSKGSNHTAKAYDYSFDLHIIFRTYAKACAAERGATEVSEFDMIETELLSRFVRLDRPYEL